MGQMKRRALKQAAFERDGWQEVRDGERIWLAHCAFEGCTDVLDFRHATLDRYPVAGRDGGGYWLDNVRLACGPCNSEEGGNYNRGGGVGGYLPPMTSEVRERIKKEKRDALYKEAVKNMTPEQRKHQNDYVKRYVEKRHNGKVVDIVVEVKSNSHGVRMDL